MAIKANTKPHKTINKPSGQEINNMLKTMCHIPMDSK